MKVRTGFVSNSSSSSFLLVGFEATKEQLTKWEKDLEKLQEKSDDYWDTDKDGVGNPTETNLLGFKLDHDEYETVSMDWKKAEKFVKKLKKKYGDDIEVRIYAGTEPC